MCHLWAIQNTGFQWYGRALSTLRSLQLYYYTYYSYRNRQSKAKAKREDRWARPTSGAPYAVLGLVPGRLILKMDTDCTCISRFRGSVYYPPPSGQRPIAILRVRYLAAPSAGRGAR